MESNQASFPSMADKSLPLEFEVIVEKFERRLGSLSFEDSGSAKEKTLCTG